MIWQPGTYVNPILCLSPREETLGWQPRSRASRTRVAAAAHSPAHQLPALLPRRPAARHALSRSSLRRGGGSNCIRASAQRAGGRGDRTGPGGAYPPAGGAPHPPRTGGVTALLCSALRTAQSPSPFFDPWPHHTEYLGFFGAPSQKSGSQRSLIPLCFVPLNSLLYLP